MQNIQNNRLAEIIKENEKTIIEFTKELQSGFSQKTITIDVIETVMIKTLAVLKKSMIAAAEEIMKEESKKKLKLKSMIDVEEQ